MLHEEITRRATVSVGGIAEFTANNHTFPITTMNKQSLTALAAVVMLVAIVALCLRVQSLEQAIQTLNKRLDAGSQVVVSPIAQPQSENKADREPVFKLSEGAKHNERTSNVGVPWEGERAIIPVQDYGIRR